MKKQRLAVEGHRKDLNLLVWARLPLQAAIDPVDVILLEQEQPRDLLMDDFEGVTVELCEGIIVATSQLLSKKCTVVNKTEWRQYLKIRLPALCTHLTVAT